MRISDWSSDVCSSDLLWLKAQLNGQIMTFRADSDSLVMRGLLAVILQIYEGKRPDQIVRHDSGAVETLILTLAPSRASGLRSLKQRIRESAEAALCQRSVRLANILRARPPCRNSGCSDSKCSP